MKKVWTTLFIFSLFFLFSFSYAETFTFEVNKYSNYGGTYGGDYNTYISDLVAIDEKTHNQYSAALPNLEVSDDIVSNYPYQIFCMYNGTYYYIFSDSPIYAKGPYSTESVDYILNKYCGLFTIQNSKIYQFTTNGTSWNSTYYTRSAKQKFFSVSWASPIYYANHEILHYTNGSVICPYSNKVIPPKMENPLTDDEIKSILQIFIDSVKDANLPEHYGRYVLTYNKVTERYTGFVYPNYINLGMKYCDFNENEEFYYVENSTGSYYLFTEYSKNDDYISQFLEGINLGMKKPLLYEFRSNSNNTFFRFNTTYDFGAGFENSFVLSTLDEPIIYTSHKIYSLFLVGEDSLGFGKYEEDEETSIDNKVLTDDETGLPVDSTLNDYTDEVNTDINLLSFIQLLFAFIFSVIGFLVRFFAFIVSFIIVPASTNILPEGFIQGIDWIHSFAFGDILLWDIFSVLFGVLLSIYIVKLIRSH